jgi:hypothetical protein
LALPADLTGGLHPVDLAAQSYVHQHKIGAHLKRQCDRVLSANRHGENFMAYARQLTLDVAGHDPIVFEDENSCRSHVFVSL